MKKILYYIKWIVKIPTVISNRKKGTSVFSFLLSKLSDSIKWRLVLPFSHDLSKQKIKVFNKFFDRQELPIMKHLIKEIRSYDLYLRNYLVAQSGLKAWEYGLLLCACDDFKNKKLLDIGSGKGTFHLFIKEKKEANVSCLDLKNPVCDSMFEELRAKSEPLGVTVKAGTILDLPFEDETFDIVTCISMIEHLQIDPETRKFISYVEFIEKTKIGLKEICRVLKKSGRLFLTTEAYIQELTNSKMTEIYNISGINSVFIKTLKDFGMEFIGQYDYNIEKLRNSEQYSNYRGRYNTTFSIYMKKK